MMKFLMLSCKEATRLTEKLFEGKLNLLKEWQLSMHLKVCEACKRYSQQSTAIDKAFRERLESSTEELVDRAGKELPNLSSEQKEAIIKRLENLL
jgi:anti-sigma factor RsiW